MQIKKKRHGNNNNNKKEIQNTHTQGDINTENTKYIENSSEIWGKNSVCNESNGIAKSKAGKTQLDN